MSPAFVQVPYRSTTESVQDKFRKVNIVIQKVKLYVGPAFISPLTTASPSLKREVSAGFALKHAWEFLADNFMQLLSFELYQNYNCIIRPESAERGILRTRKIGITYTDYLPPIPDASSFDRIVETALATFRSPGEQGAALFLLLAKAQLLFDGNKRSAQMLVNHLFACRDDGMALLVAQNQRDNFIDFVLDFYNGLSLDDAVLDFDEQYIHRF